MRIDNYTILTRGVYGHANLLGDPKPGEIQVFCNDKNVPQMINFLCPCGCGHFCPTHVITIAEKSNPPPNQSEFDKHCWGFDPVMITLIPSVRWTGGCKHHFNITNGKVEHHQDSGK